MAKQQQSQAAVEPPAPEPETTERPLPAWRVGIPGHFATEVLHANSEQEAKACFMRRHNIIASDHPFLVERADPEPEQAG